MVQYVEEEFGRLRSETPSRDRRINAVDTNRRRTRSFFNRGQSLADSLVDEDGDTAMEIDPQPPPRRILQTEPVQYPRFIIAIDFGTTFSSVAVLRLDNSTSAALIGPESIQCIDHYPDMPPRGSASAFSINPTVPTELICFAQRSNRVVETSQDSDISDQQSVGSFQEIWDDLRPENSDEEPRTPVVPSPSRGTRDSVWGWGVHCRLSSPEIMSPEMKHLTNFKLQLDDSSPGRDLGKESKDKMRALKGVKTVDIITEYLGHLLKHAKERLAQMHDLHADSCVEFVLCLPTKWTDKAARVMQTALTAAIEKSRIANLKNGAIDNLFIVAESEAAAAHVLVGEGLAAKLATHESFLVLDCGGGTVDAVTYTLTQQEPVRLKEEVSPEGRSCGSSFLNQGFQQLLKRRLEKATIIGNNSSFEQIIAAKVQDFESQKRTINLLDNRTGSTAIHIQGLQHPSKDSRQHYLDIPWKEMLEEVFKPCLRGVEELMLDQLMKARDKELNVQTVILIGGFAASPTLKGHLAAILRRERNLLNQRIQLLPSESVDSAVARGAILRALRKEDGPARISRSSYGFVRNEAYDPNNTYHRKAHIKIDRADGEHYLVDTIVWVLDKVRSAPSLLLHLNAPAGQACAANI